MVSEDGTKQDNAAYTAIQQVVNGFVPCALDYAFSYNINYTNVIDPDDELKFEPGVDALIPVVVTNASLFRLKPEIKDLDLIRKASGPTEVADNVGWTWCYHDVPARLGAQNIKAVQRHIRKFPELVYRFPNIEDGMYDYAYRPNWIAIVNITSLNAFIRAITNAFAKIETLDVKTFLRPRRVPSKKSHKKNTEKH